VDAQLFDHVADVPLDRVGGYAQAIGHRGSIETFSEHMQDVALPRRELRKELLSLPREDDDATQGCLSWLQGWCEGSQAAPRDITVMARVGARAIWLMRQGVPRAELQRLMWAGGRDHDTYGEADACSG